MKIQTLQKRKKGNDYEREIAQDLRLAGLDKNAKRMVLSGGAFGLEGDILTDLPIHIEAKRQEITKFQEWYRQSEGSASRVKIPIVVWRENNGISFTYLKWNDFMEIMKFAINGGWKARLPFHK